MTVREADESYEAECESKLRKYGFILTYGTTAPNVKVAGAQNYPVGVGLQATKKPDGTLTSSVRIAYAKRGLVKVFCRGTHSSINIGDAIQADASGCADLLAKAKFAAQSFCAKPLASMVGISQEKILSNVSGYIKVDLMIHTVPKP